MYFCFFFCHSGDISSLYDDADHYWDFEQSPVSQIIDKRTGKTVTVHGSPVTLDSPTGKGIHLQGTSENSSVDLLQVSDSSCLFDPSTCTTGLSVAMFVKFRRRWGRSINNTQMFFGNSAGVEFRQGVTIFYDEDRGVLNATVFGSTNYCFRWLHLVVNSWTHIHLKWNSSGESEEMLNVYVEGNGHSSGDVTCGNITTPLPTERNYSLGHVAFPMAYFDNLAIWYQDKPPFNAPWNYITGKGQCELLASYLQFFETKVYDLRFVVVNKILWGKAASVSYFK